MSRRRVLIGLLALALLGGGHFLLWRWAGLQMQRAVAAQQAQWRAQGWTVVVGPARRGGWPLHARLTLPAIALSGPLGPPGGVAWSAEAVVLDLSLLHPRTLVVDILGQQQLRIGPGQAIPVRADTARARVPLIPGVPPHALDLEFTGLRAGPPGAELTAAHAQLHLAEQPGAVAGEPAVSLSLQAETATLPPPPPGQVWALGRQLESLALDAALTGPISGLPDPQARAEAWRDGGGTLAVDRLALRWGPLDLHGRATLALDEALQPMGTATIQATGQGQALDALTAAHVLAPSVAQATKAVLSLMARTPPGGGPASVSVPLALQDRTLSMGRIPLLRLPLLLWPQLRWSDAP